MTATNGSGGSTGTELAEAAPARREAGETRPASRPASAAPAPEAAAASSGATNHRHERGPEPTREILNIEEAADLLGVSLKTFNKVLHTEAVPARKIGREWKFSRRALIEWVGNGRSPDFYREEREDEESEEPTTTLVPEKPKARRTAGWQIEYD